MAEAQDYVKNSEVKDAETMSFIKNFVKLKGKDAVAIRGKIKELDLIQLGDSHIVKIIDLMPQTNEELNKILSDVSVSEDDIKKILDIIAEFK